MRVCFIDPKGIHFGLNTGIGYLAAYLKENSALVDEVKVFDFNNNSNDIDQRVEEIKGFDVIGFSMKSFTKDNALEFAYKVKTDKNILVAGGPHTTLDGVNLLKENDIFDFGALGEGEYTMCELIEAIGSDGRSFKIENIKKVKGIIYRSDGEVLSTELRGRTKDLSDLPFPDYSVFDSITDNHIANYPLVTSRGCPYPCTYCCVQGVIGKDWVFRPVEGILDELNRARELYGVDTFNIQDDNFTLDMKRARKFCDVMVAEKMNMKWSCPNGIRADKIDDDLMARMYKAGCFAVAMGIESGVEEEFNAIKKGEELSDIVKAVEIAKRNNVWVFGNFIIGLPHSSLESIRESVRFAKRLNLESCIFNILVPFPGTAVWEWVKENSTILMDWKEGFTQGKNPKVVFETTDFSSADRIRAYWEANIKCKNYFACMDEHDGLATNAVRVLITIVKYDIWGLPSHLFWCMKHARRILTRVVG
jgi:radical SAM superfamily enzyme YgiQ (UPF0313 family)